VSEIGSLGLQNVLVATAVGFFDVLSPLLMLLLSMVVVVLIVPVVQK
jgi:hypothetical protein